MTDAHFYIYKVVLPYTEGHHYILAASREEADAKIVEVYPNATQIDLVKEMK